jgi:protein-L-isoaspartate(D-aspartate) O-methyltransferase
MLTLGGFEPEPAPLVSAAEEAVFAAARARMVREQIMARGVTDGRVLAALSRVPRHAFVPVPLRGRAYEDGPLPIGHGQTISQPYVVAFMTEALAPQPTDRVLEIGTGSGYQAAVLSSLVAEVYSIEIVAGLAQRAEADLRRTGCANVQVRAGNGYLGWPEAAPFDAIIVTCAPEAVPRALVDQLKVGGRMIIPVGPQSGAQELCLLRKRPHGLATRAVLPVRFVPMVGKADG